jgi:hypothetical protein
VSLPGVDEQMIQPKPTTGPIVGRGQASPRGEVEQQHERIRRMSGGKLIGTFCSA